MNRFALSLTIAALAIVPAWADPVPVARERPSASGAWAAITIFAIVIGMMAAIVIWRRRR